MTIEEMRQEIYDTVKIISSNLINKTDFLYLVEGAITNIDSFNNVYSFQYNGDIYNGISLTGERFEKGDLVYILFSNVTDVKKLIVTKKNRYSSFKTEDIDLSGYATVQEVTDLTNEVIEVNNKIDLLSKKTENDKNELKKEITNTNTRLDSVSNDLSTTKTELSSVKKDTNATKADVENLKGRLAALEKKTSIIKDNGDVNANKLTQYGRDVLDYNTLPPMLGVRDFNTLWQQSAYVFNNAANANNSPNSPKLGAGFLTIKTNGDYWNKKYNDPWLYTVQTFQSLTGAISTRTRSTDANGNGNWTSWTSILTDSNTTDRIIDSGSNSNGKWWKYNSGRMVCQHIIRTRSYGSEAWGSMFFAYTDTPKWTYPQTFVGEIPALSASPRGGIFGLDNNYLYECNGMYVMRPVNSGFRDEYITIEAVGRWK